ncbi:MAG: hypothetical protein IPG75_22600 [Gemmatimonadetes bacterium]|nr:hypothetical protein [Gemmatimonadota bacterium]
MRLWPFDGPLTTLLAQPGCTVAEIYPAEAYGQLGVTIGSRNLTSKRKREHRQAACAHRLAGGCPSGSSYRRGGAGGDRHWLRVR